MTFTRRMALRIAGHASRWMPPARQPWAAAMRGELDCVADDREALGWAAGCLRVSLGERLRSVYVPDSPAIRVAIAVPLLLLLCNDLFPTVITAAYRLGLIDLTRALGRATPGDDFTRLIPLMENLPLWLHALTSAAAVLYAFTVLRLLARARVSWIPVMLAVALEAAAGILGRPLIEAIGVRADPHPSLLATIVAWAPPLGAALYLWRMRCPPTVVE